MRVRRICMLGTDPTGNGGVASVIRGYGEAGFDQRWPMLRLITHQAGTKGKKIRRFMATLARFVWALARGELAIVHAHTASGWSFYRKSVFLLLARLAHVPTIAHIHGGSFDVFYERGCGILGRCYVRFVLSGCDRILVVSDRLREFVGGVVGEDRVVWIGNAVVPDGTPLSQVEFIAGQAKVVLFMGRLSKGKGFRDLLHATAGLREAGWDVELWAAGDGDLETAVSAAEALGIGDRVRVLGWLGPVDKAEAMARASVFCLPSYAEGLPMALLEAMGAGLPVVATPVGGIPEVVTHGREGYLVRPGSVKELQQALEWVLSNDTRRRAMSGAARDRIAKQFSVDSMIEALENVYERLGARRLRRA